MSILFLPMTKLFHSVRTAFVILEKMLVGKWFLSEHIPCPPVLVLGPQETPPPGEALPLLLLSPALQMQWANAQQSQNFAPRQSGPAVLEPLNNTCTSEAIINFRHQIVQKSTK